MTEKIKIAASILDNTTEIITINPKTNNNKNTIDIKDWDLLEKTNNINELNNLFVSILNKYRVNTFDLFNLKDISKELNININIINNKKYDIDFLLYRIATNLNTSLLVEKEYNNQKLDNKKIKLHLTDLETKFEYLMNEIQKIEKNIKRINEIKKEIEKQNNIIIKHLEQTDNLSLEKLKLEKIEIKIEKVKKTIYNKVNIINEYIKNYIEKENDV